MLNYILKWRTVSLCSRWNLSSISKDKTVETQGRRWHSKHNYTDIWKNLYFSLRYNQQDATFSQSICFYKLLYIASISLKYNQQDATFPRSIYFYKLLYMCQAVPPPIIRSTKLNIQRQVLSNQWCCLLLSWMRRNGVPSHPRQQQAAVLVWQYLTLYVQFCAPDDGRRNQ